MHPSIGSSIDCHQDPSLALPLSSLYNLCQKLSAVVADPASQQQQRLAAEQRLWNEVKKLRHLNDAAVYDYLIGYYDKIVFQLGQPRRSNDLFFYHVLIRLGDLSRYSGDEQQAKFYYSNARNLFPTYGHAYNQLALLTPPNQLYRCCYYYARAAKSIHEPLCKVSDGNLRIAVNKYNCSVLSHVLNEEPGPLPSDSTLPAESFDWLYLIIVAIYADNLQPISRPFILYLMNNFIVRLAPTNGKLEQTLRFPCDESSFILLATFDVMLDWIGICQQGKQICQLISNELVQIKNTMSRLVSSSGMRTSSVPAAHNDTTLVTPSTSSLSISTMADQRNTSSSSISSPSLMSMSADSPAPPTQKQNDVRKSYTALLHDYLLRGYEPLSTAHNRVSFDDQTDNIRFLDDVARIGFNNVDVISSRTFFLLMERIQAKLEDLSPMIRKKTRNIALDSIRLGSYVVDS